ncbi:MAG: PQQ-dependent sugar dehydrogenase, partial [Actinobacteria bacterium]|nr:PQQ-dependent sugar dehydrogenase [Actinomycetota bacterium]
MRALLTFVLGVLISGCSAGGGGGDSADRGRPATEDAQARTATTEGPERLGEGAPRLRRSRGGPRIEVVGTGLEVPWDVAFLPDGRALVTERPGRIRLTSPSGRVRRRTVARIPVEARGEGGLLGIAVDPSFGKGSDFVYVYVTRADGMQVRRMRFRGDRLADAGLVLGGIAAGPIHDSGRLRFGPDRRLYI